MVRTLLAHTLQTTFLWYYASSVIDARRYTFRTNDKFKDAAVSSIVGPYV